MQENQSALGAMAAVLSSDQQHFVGTPRGKGSADKLRAALRQHGRLTARQLAELAQIDDVRLVWGNLRSDFRAGRVRTVPGSRPMLIELSTPHLVHARLEFRAVARFGLPDAMTTVLLDRPDSDEPWPGYWDGKQWCGTDGFPCEEPTHWAEWPRGLR